MWISKKEYKALQNRLAYYEGIQQHCMNLMQENSNLRKEVSKLAYKIITNKEKCYDVTLLLLYGRPVKYSITAINHDEARKIAIKQFEKDNLALSKDDVEIIFSEEIKR